MQDQCNVRHAHTTTAEAANRLLDRIEVELDRLRRARPGLEARITKASNILVSHLAGRPRMQVVRVRISPTGKARLLFASLSDPGVVYRVDPQSLSCSCPAAHRYQGVCKHGIAAWVLLRVAQPVAEQAASFSIRESGRGGRRLAPAPY